MIRHVPASARVIGLLRFPRDDAAFDVNFPRARARAVHAVRRADDLVVTPAITIRGLPLAAAADQQAPPLGVRLPAAEELVRLGDAFEKEDWGDGSYRWYVWDSAGKRYWLTSNYDNPVDKFVEALRERKPDIAVTIT